MERKLASIRKVLTTKPIEGADAIELAVVDGWQTVIKKGEFQAGDLCVYFEIDSFLPIREEFEFLRKSSYKKMGEEEGFRLKTIRLRGELSQGLIVPMKSLEKFMTHDKWVELYGDEELEYVVPYEDWLELKEGDDVTAIMGVEKYEAPIPTELRGQIRGSFPSYIRKTDEERIQNLFYKVKDEMVDVEFEVSLKLDGTSCTFYVVDPTVHNTKLEEPADVYFGHCSRNLDTKDTDNTPWTLAKESGIKERMIAFFNRTGRSIAIQGELMGPSIQGNREKLTKPEFFLFNIWDIDQQRYLTPAERADIVEELQVKTVPILHTNLKVFEIGNDINDILLFAEGESINNPIREGLVFKSNILYKGELFSFKAISNKFLLKGGE